jgi:hypothetical protein
MSPRAKHRDRESRANVRQVGDAELFHADQHGVRPIPIHHYDQIVLGLAQGKRGIGFQLAHIDRMHDLFSFDVGT